MKLREGIPEPVEFRLDLVLTPKAVKPNETTQLKFTVRDPLHDHPVFEPDGDFVYNLAFRSRVCIASWATSIRMARRRN